MMQTTALAQSGYNFHLVILSLTIAIVSSYIAFDFVGRFRAMPGRIGYLCLLGGAYTLGLGIWMTHFVGMMASVLFHAVVFDKTMLMLAINSTTVGVGLAFVLIRRPNPKLRHLITGGVLMGLSIHTLHYLSLQAMIGSDIIPHRLGLWLLSGLVTICLGTFALWLVFSPRGLGRRFGNWTKVMGASVMALALINSHYADMNLVHMIPVRQSTLEMLAMRPIDLSGLALLMITLTALLSSLLMILNSHMEARHRQAEERLIKSEERFRRISESNMLGITFADIHGNITDANDAFLSMVGYSREDVLVGELCWRDITPADQMARDRLAIEELKVHGVFRPFEKRCICKDGRMVDLLIGGAFVDGSRESTVCYVLDITHRKQMDKALRDSEERYRRLYQWEKKTRQVIQQLQQNLSLDEVLHYVVQQVGDALQADRCFILGFENKKAGPIRYEYLKNSADKSLLGEIPPWEACPLMSQCADRYTVYVEDTQTSPLIDDLWKTFFNGLGIRGFFGVPTFYKDELLSFLVVHTVTPRLWQEHEIFFLKVVCEQMAIVLYQARVKEELERTSQLKSRFVSNMSHELRTPLNSVIGFSEMLASGMAGELTPKQHKYVHNITISGQHLLDMVNDILDLSKIEAGRMALAPEWVELRPLLYEMMDMLEDLAYRNNVRMQLDIAPQVEGLYADPSRLRQILLNLASNAIKFNRDDGTVTIRLFCHTQYEGVIFQVEDTGIGIPKAQVPHLFTEFYQVDNATNCRQEGTGLGLALTKRLIELHGGDISFDSTEGVGSVFTFRLPQRYALSYDTRRERMPGGVSRAGTPFGSPAG